MKLFCIVVAFLLLWTSTAFAFEVGGEYFLVKDKTITAIELGGRVSSRIDLSTDIGLVFSDRDETSQGANGTFLGSLIGLHLFYRQPITQGIFGRIGGGVDYWPLYGINTRESHAGLVFITELRGNLMPRLDAFLRARYYIVRGDGLQPGVDRFGDESAPVLCSTGLTWSF